MGKGRKGKKENRLKFSVLWEFVKAVTIDVTSELYEEKVF